MIMHKVCVETLPKHLNKIDQLFSSILYNSYSEKYIKVSYQ